MNFEADVIFNNAASKNEIFHSDFSTDTNGSPTAVAATVVHVLKVVVRQTAPLLSRHVP